MFKISHSLENILIQLTCQTVLFKILIVLCRFLFKKKQSSKMGNEQCRPQRDNFIPPKEVEDFEEENPGNEVEYLEGISHFIFLLQMIYN